MSNLAIVDKSDSLVNMDGDSDYEKVVAIILDSMRIDTNQIALDEEFLTAMTISWSEHLQRNKVPKSMLVQVYNRALDIRAKTAKRTHFSVEDMLTAWFQLQDEATHAKITKPLNCNKCNNTGYVRVTQASRTVELICNH